MKKILSLFLLITLLISNSITFADFKINTDLPLKTQEAVKMQLDNVYKKFEMNLGKKDLDSQISAVGNINSSISKLLSKSSLKKLDHFVLEYLRYLFLEKKVALIKEKSKLNTPKEEPKKEDVSTGQIIEEVNTGSALMLPENTINTTLFLAGSKDQRILSFRVKAEYDDIRLKDLYFSGNGLENLNNFRLLMPNGEQISASSVNGNNISFLGLNSKEAIKRDTYAIYNILADINSNINGKTFNISFNVANSSLLSSTGKSFAFSNSSAVSSKDYTISNNTSNVIKLENDSKNLFTSALKFSVSAFGNNEITLAGATFKNTFSGYDTTNAKIQVYRNYVNNFNLLGETSIGEVSGKVNFTQNNTIESGNVNTYVVIIDGIQYDSTKKSQDWIISLTDLETMTGLHFSDYSNLGNFPLTEVK